MSLRYFLFWWMQVTVVRTKSQTFLYGILTTQGKIMHTIPCNNPLFTVHLFESVVLSILLFRVDRFQQMAGHNIKYKGFNVLSAACHYCYETIMKLSMH